MTPEEQKHIRDVLSAGFESFLGTFPSPAELDDIEREVMRVAFVAGGAFALGQFMGHLVASYTGLRTSLVEMSRAAEPFIGKVEREEEEGAKA